MTGTFPRVWLTSFLLLFLLGGVWVLATPMASPPDEPAQIMKAYAMVHGQLIGSQPGPGQPEAVTAVDVPQDLASLQPLASCFHHDAATPAGCSAVVPGTTKVVRALTYVGRYPPLYYLFVGLPTLVGASPGVVYWMRLVSLLLSALFLSLAFAAGWRWSRSRLLVAAIAVAVTPLSLYLAASVNPNGLEISVAICLWTTVLILIVDHVEHPPRSLIAAAGACAVVLPLVRGLSPFFEVMIAVAMVPLLWGRPVGGLLRRTDVRMWLALACVSGLVAAGWLVAAHTLNQLPGAPLPAGTSTGHLVRLVAGQTSGFFLQYLGTFGAFDVNAPQMTILAWVGACAVLVTLAVVLSTRLVGVCLGWAAFLALAVPGVLGVAEARSAGLVGQGRYYLPLAVGVPLIAGASRGPQLVLGAFARRVAGAIAVLVATGQMSAFFWALRRFLVGSNGPLNPLAHVPSGWSPPFNPLALDAAAVIGSLLFGWWVLTLAGARPRVDEAPSSVSSVSESDQPAQAGVAPAG